MSSSSPPGLFAEDLIPALTILSKLLDSFARPAVIVFLALYPVSILGDDWRSNTIPVNAQPGLILLIASIVWFGGFFRETSGEPWAALQTVNNRVGGYFRVGLFAALSVYIPIYHNLPAPFQPWLQGLLISAIGVLGLFGPVEKFNGPLRFGYMEYAAQFSKLYGSLPTSWTYTALILVLPHVILPWLSLGVILLSAVTFVHVSQQYQKQLDIIKGEISTEVSRADVAAGFARDYVAEAKDCEVRLLKVVAITRKDVLQAESVHIVDFFDRTVGAWGALGRVIAPAKDTTSQARAVVQAAIEANQADLMGRVERGAGGGDGDDGDGDDRGIAEDLIDAANLAVEVAEDVEKKLKVAREMVAESERAADQRKITRQKAVLAATDAVEASKNLAGQIQGVGTTLYEAVEGAESVRRLGGRVSAVATEGEMQAARSLLISLKSKAKEVEGLKVTLARKAEAGRSILHKLLEKV